MKLLRGIEEKTKLDKFKSKTYSAKNRYKEEGQLRQKERDEYG